MARNKVTKTVDKRRVILQTVEKQTRLFRQDHALEIANHLAGRLRQMLYGQELSLAPLAPSTVAQKESRGGDPRTLIDTGQYVQSIRARRKENSNAYEVGVGPGEHDRSGALLTDIARWLEYGTRNRDGSVRMPARPHWRRIWQEFQAEKAAHLREAEKRLRKRHRGK